MEHSLNLGVGHLLSHVTPARTGSVTKGNDDDDSGEGTVPSDYSTAIISHALRKLLGLIKQVRVIHHIYCIH